MGFEDGRGLAFFLKLLADDFVEMSTMIFNISRTIDILCWKMRMRPPIYVTQDAEVHTETNIVTYSEFSSEN